MLDTLALARRLHPGQRNSLDALAKRYSVDNSKRELHGALLDAQILADIYLAMTGGQVSLSLESDAAADRCRGHGAELAIDRRGLDLAVVRATPEEERAHEAMLAVMAKRGQPIWRELEREDAARRGPRRPHTAPRDTAARRFRACDLARCAALDPPGRIGHWLTRRGDVCARSTTLASASSDSVMSGCRSPSSSASTTRPSASTSRRIASPSSSAATTRRSRRPARSCAAAKHLTFSTDAEALADCNTFIVTVPTPVGKNNRPVLTPLKGASETVGSVLKRGDVVVYESTVYPGCTEEYCVPILEQKSGLKFNKDFFCGYSPERINPGDKQHRLPTIKKVTSGSTPEIADYVDALYAQHHHGRHAQSVEHQSRRSRQGHREHAARHQHRA